MQKEKRKHVFGLNFRHDLAILFEDRIADTEFCKDLWGAMANVSWKHAFFGTYFDASFRGAGGIIAGLRGDTSEMAYLKWYCSSLDGVITEEILSKLTRVGWVPSPM